MGNLGFQEILLIAVVILVLFGGRKIPEFMRGLGKGIREFNDAKDNVKSEIEMGLKDTDKDEEIRRLRQQVEQTKMQQTQAQVQQPTVQQPQ